MYLKWHLRYCSLHLNIALWFFGQVYSWYSSNHLQHTIDLFVYFLLYSNVQCGQLHCVVGTFQGIAGISVTILTVGVSGGGECK